MLLKDHQVHPRNDKKMRCGYLDDIAIEFNSIDNLHHLIAVDQLECERRFLAERQGQRSNT